MLTHDDYQDLVLPKKHKLVLSLLAKASLGHTPYGVFRHVRLESAGVIAFIMPSAATQAMTIGNNAERLSKAVTEYTSSEFEGGLKCISVPTVVLARCQPHVYTDPRWLTELPLAIKERNIKLGKCKAGHIYQFAERGVCQFDLRPKHMCIVTCGLHSKYMGEAYDAAYRMGGMHAVTVMADQDNLSYTVRDQAGKIHNRKRDSR